MHHHRFIDHLSAGVAEEASTPVAQGFVACPLVLPQGQGQGCPWQHVYQFAFEQARAVVRPSRLERYQKTIGN